MGVKVDSGFEVRVVGDPPGTTFAADTARGVRDFPAETLASWYVYANGFDPDAAFPAGSSFVDVAIAPAAETQQMLVQDGLGGQEAGA